ncbi:hypothetical protein J4H86_22685 [Spiractinospora alimapuensis]|uniref:hypothetical protein n=1 Tax=Spiractinospora alimapuensis TaxID=2820884 RepID=UPI001F339D8D|nr:hypothetical protein [Spiractinospora alimapuensis]QVQ51563.1 hypothetical protein J4H86_22685 [Spiractinospora alimapuensis]
MRIIDILIAPRATTGEIVVGFGAAFAGTALTLALALRSELPVVAIVVVGVVAFDLFGGAVVNATRSAKRWYHREGRTARHHLLFVACHIQPFLLALVIPGFSWITATTIYAATLVAAVLVTAAPPSLRRPLAFTLVVLGLTLLATVASVPPVVAWFGPVLLVKLLLAHLLPEEAAEPTQGTAASLASTQGRV